MPLVTIHIAKRAKAVTKAQKRQLAEGITDLLEQVLQKRRDSVTVLIQEHDPDNWAEGGELVSDLRRRKV